MSVLKEAFSLKNLILPMRVRPLSVLTVGTPASSDYRFS